MRAQTFAAFLLTAALPAIVAALPANMPSDSQLTGVPTMEARSTQEAENLPDKYAQHVSRRQDGGQIAYTPDVASSIGEDNDDDEDEPGAYPDTAQGSEGPEAFMGGDDLIPEDFGNFGGLDDLSFGSKARMLLRRGIDPSNYEGPLEARSPEEPQQPEFNDPERLETRSIQTNMGEDDRIPSQFRRRQSDDPNEDGNEHPENLEPINAHSGHNDDKEYENGDRVDKDRTELTEDEGDALGRRQLGDIALADDDDEDGPVGMAPGLASHGIPEANVYDYTNAKYQEEDYGNIERRQITHMEPPNVKPFGYDGDVQRRDVAGYESTPDSAPRRVARSFRA